MSRQEESYQLRDVVISAEKSSPIEIVLRGYARD